MTNKDLAPISTLTDEALLSRTLGLARRARQAVAVVIAYLAELHRRGAVLRAGYSGLFVYCRDGLGMTEDEAYNRAKVAETARAFPMVVDLLLRDEVSVTAVRLVAPHLTEGNHAAVLQSIRGRRRSQVEEIVAALAPRPDSPTLLRKLPAPRAAATATPLAAPTLTERPSPIAATHPVITPTAPERFRIQLTTDRETVDMLRRLKDLMRHAVPNGDEAEIVKRALATLLAETERRKFAKTGHPRDGRPAEAGSRHIPAAVQREVWDRDGGRCAFVATGGRRCGETAFLEFHHRHPFGYGGGSTVDNVSLRCRKHNAWEAQLDFGGAAAGRAHRPSVGPGA